MLPSANQLVLVIDDKDTKTIENDIHWTKYNFFFQFNVNISHFDPRSSDSTIIQVNSSILPRKTSTIDLIFMMFCTIDDNRYYVNDYINSLMLYIGQSFH
jgi:hypothetical protein